MEQLAKVLSTLSREKLVTIITDVLVQFGSDAQIFVVNHSSVQTVQSKSLTKKSSNQFSSSENKKEPFLITK